MTGRTGRRVKLRIFNVRGLKNRLQTVSRIAEEVRALALCETWVTNKSDAMCEPLNETEVAPTTADLRI